MGETLAGKVAIVSGSSSGIGAATAHELARRGAHVVVHYPTPQQKEDADEVLAGLNPNRRHITVEADLSTLTGPEWLAESAAKEFGHIDILINNAGTAVSMPMEEQGPEIWNQLVNLNGRGTLFLTQAVLKHLTCKNSRIVNVGSSQTRDPALGACIYVGTKGMVEAFTRSWAKELPRKYGCTVNLIAPGPVATPLMQNATPEFHEKLAPVLSATPVASRMAQTSEIAWTIANLCEPEAGWQNGSFVLVSGGLHM